MLASSAGAHWEASRAITPQAANAARNYEFRKTRVINVPIVSDGALEGYVIVQFLYAIDARAAETLNVSPGRLPDGSRLPHPVWRSPSLDFRHLEKYDMSGLTADRKTMLNQKLGEGMVSEVLIQEFSYMPKEQAPR